MIGKCKWCGASVKWAKTKNKKPIPLDLAPHVEGSFVLDFDGTARRDIDPRKRRYKTHLETCPRKPK